MPQSYPASLPALPPTAWRAPGARGHHTALDAIAEGNGNTRACGIEGYSDSVDHVVGKLTAGHTPTVQPFLFPSFAEVSPAVLEQSRPDDVTNGADGVATMTYSAARDVSGVIETVG